MDLIDRNAVLKLPRNITKNLSGEVIEETIDVDRIKRLPSVQSEIILCKDCKFFIDHRCYFWPMVDNWRGTDDFCSYAERKKDG